MLLDVENKLGRVRTEKDGPRTLDLDLLLYGQEILTIDDRVPNCACPIRACTNVSLFWSH